MIKRYSYLLDPLFRITNQHQLTPYYPDPFFSVFSYLKSLNCWWWWLPKGGTFALARADHSLKKAPANSVVGTLFNFIYIDGVNFTFRSEFGSMFQLDVQRTNI